MANPWFRLYSEFLTDPKVQRLSEQDQRRLVLIFCMRCNGNVTLHDDDVTFMLRISEDEWMRSKAIFIDRGFMTEDGEITNWDKRQFISDSSKDRVAKHRANKKTAHETVSNVTVTTPDTESDTDSESKQKNIIDSLPAQKVDSVPYQEIVNLYHRLLPKNPRVAMLNSKRKGQIAARWKSGVLPDLKTWEDYFTHISESPFLMGHCDPPPGRKRFVADLEWITNESNFTKIAEGKYHGKV